MRVAVARLLRQLRSAHSDMDLTPSQTVALSRLATDGPMTVADLARAELKETLRLSPQHERAQALLEQFGGAAERK